MSTSTTVRYLRIQATPTLQSLAQTAGNELAEEAVAAKGTTPVLKLTYKPTCVEVTSEYNRVHY
jgi:hypothetical protein